MKNNIILLIGFMYLAFGLVLGAGLGSLLWFVARGLI